MPVTKVGQPPPYSFTSHERGIGQLGATADSEGCTRRSERTLYAVGSFNVRFIRFSAAGHTKGEASMQMAVIYAFVVIAGAPLVGIWRAHAWAKKNGLSLRKAPSQTEHQVA